MGKNHTNARSVRATTRHEGVRQALYADYCEKRVIPGHATCNQRSCIERVMQQAVVDEKISLEDGDILVDIMPYPPSTIKEFAPDKKSRCW